MEQNGQKQWMRRYLLGQMSPEERASVEARYIDKDELFEELLEGENAMLDAYVRGSVSEEDKRLIERQYLTTAERRDRVAFAKALQQLKDRERTGASGISPAVLSRSAPQKSPAYGWGLGLACACVVALIAVAWLAVENHRLRLDLRSAQAELARLAGRQQELEHELQIVRTQPGTQATDPGNDNGKLPVGTIAMTLSPFTLRDGTHRGNTLEIPGGASAVQLTLTKAVRLPACQMVLQTAEGAEVWRKTGLSSALGTVVVAVPANRLPEGDYIVKLRGVTGDPPANAGDYSLRVVKH